MNITKHEAETLVRLAASIIDEHDHAAINPVAQALRSFGDPDEVEELARKVAHYTYYAGEDLVIES